MLTLELPEVPPRSCRCRPVRLLCAYCRAGASDMAVARISKRTVDAAKAQAGDSYVWDRELSGFGLKVTPAGRKVYLVQYRIGGHKGRTRRVTIGPHLSLIHISE